MNVNQHIKPTCEFDFMLLCSETKTGQNFQRMEELIDSGMDWKALYIICQQHKLFPIVYAYIKKQFSEKIPGSVLADFKNLYLNNAAKNLYFSASLLQIIDLFKANDIFVLPFKGPVLAQNIYNNIELRYFGDLDILIHKKHSVKAWNILEKKGFVPKLNLSTSQKKKYIKTEDHIAFTKNNLCLELHWEMSGLYLNRSLGLEKVSGEIEDIAFLNREIPNLGLEHLIVFLCIHGTKHGWQSMEQVCCLSGAVKKKPDWKLVEALANQWRCKNMVAVGLQLLHTFFNPDIPDNLLNKNDKKIISMANEITGRLIGTESAPNLQDTLDRFSIFHIKIRDSLIDKIQYCLRLVFCPTDKEWLYYPVPGFLSFLHFFLRPLRLAMARLG